MRHEERARKVDAALRATDDGDKGQGSGTRRRDQEGRARDPAWKVAQGDEGVIEDLLGDAGGGARGAVEDGEQDKLDGAIGGVEALASSFCGRRKAYLWIWGEQGRDVRRRCRSRPAAGRSGRG